MTVTPLFISMSGIARLADVQRPVVSVWRSRAAGSPLPFPDPVALDGGTEVFDAREVAEWLVATGRGNNSDVVADAAAFARADASRRGDVVSFESLTALVAVRAAAGAPIGGLGRAGLLDLVDELDPADSCIVREVVAVGDDVPALARFVDVLVDGAYSAAAAFESLMADRFREGRRELMRTALTTEAESLVADLAAELARANPAGVPEHPVFVDPTGVCGDLVLGVVAPLVERVDAGVVLAASDDPAARLLRRRLLAHGVLFSTFDGEQSELASLGAVTHVSQFPTPARPVMTAKQILAAVEEVALQMDDSQRAVFLAPSSVLTDAGLPTAAEVLRADMLRSGRVRAVVRLPQGLVVGNPRQALALWVLGPALSSVALAERWTLTADLADLTLNAEVREALVGDLVAAMGDAVAVRSHAFWRARPQRTSALIARAGSLVEGAEAVSTVLSAPVRPQRSGDHAVRVDSLSAQLPTGLAAVAAAVHPSAEATVLPPAALGGLVEARHVRCLPGTRLDSADVGSVPGYRVVGVGELADPDQIGTRTIDRLVLEQAYPSARLTSPGDVVFCTSPQPRAWVDEDGLSVVMFPARVFRIDGADPGGLLPRVLAAEVNRQSARDWRRWSVRRVVPAEREGMSVALDTVAQSRAALVEQLRVLDEFSEVLVDGVASGALTVGPADGQHADAGAGGVTVADGAPLSSREGE